MMQFVLNKFSLLKLNIIENLKPVVLSLFFFSSSVCHFNNRAICFIVYFIVCLCWIGWNPQIYCYFENKHLFGLYSSASFKIVGHWNESKWNYYDDEPIATTLLHTRTKSNNSTRHIIMAWNMGTRTIPFKLVLSYLHYERSCM